MRSSSFHISYQWSETAIRGIMNGFGASTFRVPRSSQTLTASELKKAQELIAKDLRDRLSIDASVVVLGWYPLDPEED